MNGFITSIALWPAVWLKICGISAAAIGWGYLALMSLDGASRGKSDLARTLRPFEFGIVGFALLYVFALAVSLFGALHALAHWTFALVGIVGSGWMALRWLAFRPDWRDCLRVALLSVLVEAHVHTHVYRGRQGKEPRLVLTA